MQEQGRPLIDHILTLLDSLRASGLTLGQLGEAGPAEAFSGLDGQSLQTACEIINFMDEMPGGFLIYHADQDERIIYANRGLLRIFQCDTIEEFRAHTADSFRGLVHPEDLEQVEESIRAQVAASQFDLDYVEYRICRRDGAVRWIEDYGHFIYVPAVGNVFYVFLADATDKREQLLAERARLLSEKLEGEQRLQSLIQKYDQERSLINQEYLRQLEVIEGLSINYESICYLDLDTDQIVPYRLSQRTALLFQERYHPLPYSQYAKSYVDIWVHPEDRELVTRETAPACIREKLAESGTYYFNYRVVVKGEIQYLQLRLVDVGRQEQVSQVVFGYRRVDEEIRQQMEQQALLSEALTKANLAIASQNAFLSNMSHDMRTPLHAIFGFTSLARLSTEDPILTDYLAQMETAGRTLLDMIDKVLEVSALSEMTGPQETACDLREILERTYSYFQPQAREKNISLRIECSRLEHSAVYGDPEKLRQLAFYLTSNAITYTNPGGQVTLSAAQGEEQVNDYMEYSLRVKDTGVGISPEFLEKVFEPFSREKNSTHSKIHGVGLGLTIAKQIVDMMGGTIEVESTIGQGSAFTVMLRLRRQARTAPERKVLSSQEASQRILLAEDNEINLEIETELLERMGFVVDPVENGALALEKLKKMPAGHYDLVLTDLQMPVMDGWQEAAAIRALADPALSGIPIIALSANVQESDRIRSRECGIDAHLVKPMDLALMLQTIERLTGKRRPLSEKLYS